MNSSSVSEVRRQRHATQEEVFAAVVDGWERTAQEHPEASQLVLAYTRADVAALNAMARDRLKARGLLRSGTTFQTINGERELAVGDQIVFLKNDRRMAVKNGTVGRVQAMRGGHLEVTIAGERGGAERTVDLDPRAYGFDFGRSRRRLSPDSL